MSTREIALRTTVVVATLLALLILWQIGVSVAILLASLALGACMYPLVEHLQERGWPRLGAIALAVAGSLLLILGFAVSMAVPLAADLQEISQDVTESIERLAIADPDHWLLRAVRPAPAPAAGEEAATPVASPGVGTLMRSAVGTVTDLIQLGAHFAICIALSVYWTIDRQRIERLWLSLVPVKRRVPAQKLWQSVERELGAYLRSELAQGLLAALLLWAGFELLGLRYAALAALAAAVLSMIPWLGSLFAIAAVLVLSSGKLVDLELPWFSIQSWVAIGYLAMVLAFLEFVIEPRLFKCDRYNSLWTVLTTLALTMTFGVWGLLFGPAVGYGIQIVLRHLHPLLFYEPVKKPTLAAIEARLALLRSQCQSEDTPPEILSFIDRLETILESQATAPAH